MKYMLLIGRICFAAVFITSGIGHFSDDTIAYAAGHGLSNANILVPLSGVMAIAGGLSILLGVLARAGAWLLVLFLLPITFFMHDFWNVTETAAAHMQQVQFYKNIAMLGGALVIIYFGAGPLSIDAMIQRHETQEEERHKMAA